MNLGERASDYRSKYRVIYYFVCVYLTSYCVVPSIFKLESDIRYGRMNSVFYSKFGVLSWLCLVVFFKFGRPATIHNRGPNVCPTLPGGCCPGWSRKTATGLCLSATCPYGCKTGRCIGPNKCYCQDNRISFTCPDTSSRRANQTVGTFPRTNKDVCALKGCQQKCSVAYGLVTCTCKRGYTLQPDTVTCTDEDECRKFRFACHHHCINTLGSFICSCRRGFTLASNRRTCVRGKSSPAKTEGEQEPSRYSNGSKDPMSSTKMKDTPMKPKPTGNLERNYTNVFRDISKIAASGNSRDIGNLKNRKPLAIEDRRRQNISRLNVSNSTNLLDGVQNDGCRGDLCRNLKRSIEDDEFVPSLSLCQPGYTYVVEKGIIHCVKIREKEKKKKKKMDEETGRSDDKIGPLELTQKENTTIRMTSIRMPLATETTTIATSYITSAKAPPKTSHRTTTTTTTATTKWTTLRQLIVTHSPNKSKHTVENSTFECADGQTIVQTSSGKICQNSDTICPEGKIPVTENGKMECKNVQQTTVACPDGQEPVVTSSGTICQYLTIKETTTPRPKCPDGQTQILSSSGYTCVDETNVRPSCSAHEILVESEAGFICISIEFKESRCGPEETTYKDENGIRCVKTTTESPCPAGLQPMKTSVGVVCSYVKNDVPKFPECTSNEKLVMTSSGYTCERIEKGNETIPNCLPSQVLINTAEGPKCGFRPEHAVEKIVCPPNKVLIDGLICKSPDMISPDEQPCPMDQELVQTKDGVKCRYRERGYQKITNMRVSRCPVGEILTQTRNKFVCKSVQPGLGFPVCNGSGEIRVRSLAGNIECVSDEQSNLICDFGHILLRKPNGYSCEASSVSENVENDFGKCRDGEILLVDEIGSRCINLLAGNLDICGDGFKVLKTRSGYVCKPLMLKFECPPGYILDNSKGYPVCQPLSGNDADVNPCADNYEIKETEVGTRCVLTNGSICKEDDEDCIPQGSPDCHSSGIEEYRVIDCRNLQSLQLECNPVCANGGTCRNGSCVCPQGITGIACNKDVDECEHLPNGYCQYRCQNTFGSYHCVCPRWATLNSDGRTCKEIGCVPECMNGGVCRNGTCECPKQFRGRTCQDDVDECAERKHSCEHYCRNTYGGYACVCPPGHRLSSDKRTCINTTCIPECRNGGKCVSNRCQCKKGFWGIICQLDINECYDLPCSHTCINTPGSYYCACPPGKYLDSDMHTCRNLIIGTSSTRDGLP